MSTDIFSLTRRPDESLFFHRDEAGDPRLGEIVRWQAADYDSAKVVLLGCPQDEGVRRNGGRIGAAAAPDAIRAWLYRLVAPEGVQLFDLGNTIIQPTLEETHDVQQQVVQQLISDGKIVISLGGGNDLSYPDCAGLAQAAGDVLAFNIDAHLDVRESPIRHSGTPYRMLLEEGIVNPRHFYEMAYQPFAVSQTHLEYLKLKGAHAVSLTDLRDARFTHFRLVLMHTCKAVFWGIDMDAVHINEAPGVSAPNPLGMTGEELCLIMTLAAKDPYTRILEFTEVNPTYDIDHRTCRLAAVAIWRFLLEAL
jgi:formiminoglutamase